MNWSREFVELDKTLHERTFFDCGEDELSDFLRTKAARHMAAGISRTMVLPASLPLPEGKHQIIAFYTIAPGSIGRETLPEKLLKKLPHYPVPVFLLAQMAVQSEYQGQGLGKITLVKALEYLFEINSHMRAYAIIVDCLNNKAESFYSKYGFEMLCHQNKRARTFLPMKTVEQLF